MTKRILSLLLAAMMVLGSLVVVSAAEPDYAAENTWAVEVLTKLNVLQGDENGDPMLDNAILRYEMALFLARALTAKTDDAYWAKVENETPFDDLLTHPYNGAATWNYNHGIIFGVTDTIFNPNGNITYQDAIVMVVRAWADYFLVDGLSGLGIKDELHYPWKHIELADDLGLTANINPTEKYLENTTRGVVAQLVYNLLTWYNGTTLSSLAAANVKVNPLHNTSIGQAKFGLVISAKTGDDLKATAIADGNVSLDKVGSAAGTDLTLKATEFANFDLTAKKDVVYTIVYYAIKDEVVVTSIVQKTANTADYVNTPADREFAPVYEATAWEDEAKTKPTTWKITGIKAGDKTYPIVGNDALALYIDDVAATGLATTGLNAAAVAEYNAIIDSLYGTLDLIDTDGDGKFNKIVITPFVFAATYKEVRVDANDNNNKATKWEFDGYAVVSYADATKTTTTNYVDRTWTWTVADAAGKKDTGATQTITAKTAEYVAPVGAETLATATKLTAAKVNYFDVEVTETNAGWVQFVGDDTQYAWGYSDLLAWDIIDTTTNAGVADYFNIARVNADDEAEYLVELWANKNASKAEDLKDDNLDGTKLQYVNAWVLDGALVAIVPATVTGESGESGTGGSTTPEYEGILVLDALKASSDVAIGKDALKIVNGKYYYATKANVDGATKDILVYLADASTYAGYDSTKPGSPVEQENAWYAAEKTKIDTAYGKIVTDLTATSGAVSTTVRFYDIDVNNNYKIVLGTVVTGENYKANVGGAYLVPAKANDETYGTSFEYVMDINSTDFIKYTTTKGTTPTEKFAQNIATNNGTWLFVGTNSIEIKTGVPEYGSYFKVASEKNIVKNDKTILVFYSEDADNTDSATDLAQAYDGFKYTMYNGVDYVIYAGVAARNDMKRDGYLYYDVVDLFTGAPGLVSVREDDTAMIAKLEAVTTQVIAAVERTNQHKLLCVYEIEEAAVKAIASLQYGSTAFATTGETSLNALVDRIAAQYNLTQIAKSQMAANTKNLVYAITAQGLVTNNIVYSATSTYYVFYTAPTATAAANFVIIVCD